MVYQFTGIVQDISPVEERGNFTFTTMVVTKTIEKRDGGTFDQSIAVQFTGQNIDKTAGLRIGDDVTVKFDIRSKEYNGKWFTNLYGSAIDVNATKTSHTNSPKNTGESNVALPPPPNDSDLLPF